MTVNIKDGFKLVGIIIITACAAFVCTLFMNYYIDLNSARDMIANTAGESYFDAQLTTCKVVCTVSGLSLVLTAVVMLLFYIGNYIEANCRRLGILKALGYSDVRIAAGFWVFGLATLLGAAVGLCAAFAFMPRFYRLQNDPELFPDISVGFHASVPLSLVMAPAVAFALIAFVYAFIKLRIPSLALVKGLPSSSEKHVKDSGGDRPFLSELRAVTLRKRKSAVFFVAFSAFCFSAMIQMGASMRTLSSDAMGVMMLIIGLVLAFATLFMSLSRVVKENAPALAMLKAFGYDKSECGRAVLGGYRPVSYIGFALGTVYQYVLLRIMVSVVYANIEGVSVPDYSFDFVMFAVTATLFVAVYEAVLRYYAHTVNKATLKSIMCE